MNMMPENPVPDDVVKVGHPLWRDTALEANLRANGPAGPAGKPLGLVVAPACPGDAVGGSGALGGPDAAASGKPSAAFVEPSGVSGGPRGEPSDAIAADRRRTGVLAAIQDYHRRRGSRSPGIKYAPSAPEIAPPADEHSLFSRENEWCSSRTRTISACGAPAEPVPGVPFLGGDAGPDRMRSELPDPPSFYSARGPGRRADRVFRETPFTPSGPDALTRGLPVR